ncbi:DUF4145 domain-containing protein [Neorhizobium galegae]|uniref:DUF4145 domain-containing protein n=1 Tax=Neorhizobium galegae TaxID=399 RepID=A0A6A1THM6_NEOGA|nr:DUF4145 domain-containing protein [Neorhizobium galegae]KAB1082236.1 DUF4145 domain-containing protein [Neorhizobium galegae]
MTACPICGSDAKIDDRSGRDFIVCDCNRCGRYKLTGSALAMLPDRVDAHDRFAARLSHAVRIAWDASHAKDLPVVTSMNLDQLGGRKLPSIDAQIFNLLSWIGAQVGDDQMAAIEIEDRDALAGIVGAVDGNRVDDLLDMALQQGVVEFVPDDCWKITIEGWRLLQAGSAERRHGAASEARKREAIAMKVDCNECGPARNAHVRASYSTSDTDDDGTSWTDTWEILECCGCNSISARRAFWFSEHDTLSQASDGRMLVERGVTETFYPGRSRRRRPAWTQKVSDPVLAKLFNELYKALAADLLIVSSICARTLFDAASTLKVGDAGNFKQKIDALVAQDMMSAADKEAVEAMTDAGNASAHRGYEPSFEQLMHIIDIVEGFIERQFYYPDIARSLRQATPPRQGRSGSRNGE